MALRWSPERFWDSTPHEYFDAMSTYLDAHDPSRTKRRRFQEFAEGLKKAGVA